MIFDCNDLAMERTEDGPGFAQSIQAARGRERTLTINVDKGADLRIELIDALQILQRFLSADIATEFPFTVQGDRMFSPACETCLNPKRR